MRERGGVLRPHTERAAPPERRHRALDEREAHAVQRAEHLRAAGRPAVDQQLEDLPVGPVGALVIADEIVQDRGRRRLGRPPSLDLPCEDERPPP